MIKNWIRAGILAIALSMTGLAQAKDVLVMDNQGNTVTLTDNTCTDPRVTAYFTYLRPEWQDREWFAGTVFYQKQLISLCYTIALVQTAYIVVIIDADGESIAFPLTEFRKAGIFDIEKSI